MAVCRQRWVPWAVAAVVLSLAAPPAMAEETGASPVLGVANLVDLQKRFATFSDSLPAAAKLGMRKITAYEEHKHFVFVGGDLSTGGGARRVIFLKPATFIVDDLAVGRTPSLQLTGSTAVPKVADGKVSMVCNDKPISWQTYRHSAVSPVVSRVGKTHTVTIGPKVGTRRGRPIVHVIHLGPAAEVKLWDRSNFERIPPDPLGIIVGKRRMTFAPQGWRGAGAGKISITEGNKTVVSLRPLPSGIMPHGPRGVRMIDRWDRVYRKSGPAPWDVGKPATELVKAVEKGTLKPGKAVVLGCGTGTNAIYLASKGFTVTAIDVAPTALTLAEAKAYKARVSVRWVLASVLAPPKLGPFDVMFDRGCYHGVRRVNAKGFVAAAAAMCKPGGKFLIIAGNANEARHYGPPRVKEKEIRDEFAPSFDIESLRETRFDTRTAGGKGPLAWSIMLRRKSLAGAP